MKIAITNLGTYLLLKKINKYFILPFCFNFNYFNFRNFLKIIKIIN